jgi:hypothetical protein
MKKTSGFRDWRRRWISEVEKWQDKISEAKACLKTGLKVTGPPLSARYLPFSSGE